MTCLCLTQNRPQWLPKAIACFEAQTYRNREMLILADGEDVSRLVPDDPRIRYVHIGNGLTIGAKRNVGCGLANGEIICHWDDDDHSEPGRLIDQVSRLVSSGRQVTGYHTLDFFDLKAREWWRWRLDDDQYKQYAPGTTLCYSRAYWEKNRFPDRQIREDGVFIENARPVFISEEARNLMYATIWPGNTSTRQLEAKAWKKIEPPPEFAAIGELR